MNKQIPIIIFAFNRPDNLKEVFDSLKEQNVYKLIIFIDGARNENDRLKREECIKLSKDINWVEKDIRVHSNNRGLTGMSKDLDEISNEYDKFIVVEDDCLPMKRFYGFMCQSLNYYENNSDVFAIGGYQPLKFQKFKNHKYSVISTKRFFCWGWATWSNKWKGLQNDRINYYKLFDNLTKVPNDAGVDLKDAANLVMQGIVKTWDIQVGVAMLWQNKVMILPTNGLIKNLGLGQGTHGSGDYHPYHNLNINNAENSFFNFCNDLTKINLNYEILNYLLKITKPTILNKLILKTKRFYWKI